MIAVQIEGGGVAGFDYGRAVKIWNDQKERRFLSPDRKVRAI